MMVLMPIAHRIPEGCGMVSLAFYPLVIVLVVLLSLVIVLVVLLSLGIAVVLDAALMKPGQALFDRIVRRLRARGDA
mgnify:CR=1 FL=1